jgi:curved DNA-binding protein
MHPSGRPPPRGAQGARWQHPSEPHGASANGHAGFPEQAFATDGGGQNDALFEAIFGRPRRAQAEPPQHGPDQQAAIQIDLLDAYQGATRAIHLGSRTLQVTIPRGTLAGQRLRLAGQGGPAPHGGTPGDLYLEVGFRPQTLYRVEGRDVHLQLPVAPWEAALGAEVKAPTPEGPVHLTIPAHSQSGRTLRLMGKGIPGHPAGNLYVTLQMALPPAHTDLAQQAYRDMAHALPFNPRAALGLG